MHFVDLKTQYQRYKSDIDRRVLEVFERASFIMGPEVTELEETLAGFVGVPHCITVASGTTSLEIALRALGIGAGDEVITVPFSWISTAEVIALVGARPVFVDIDPSDFNMDPGQIEKAITPRTKAIMPVSLFGQVADMERINEIAGRHGLPVIEDAAQSFGAARNGVRSCGLSLVGSTSFFPAKVLGCFGDGGALFTNDSNLADKMRSIRNHGCLVRHEHNLLGTNGRFDTVQAAVLLAKLPHFESELAARIRIGDRYSKSLADICETPKTLPENTHVFAQYTIRVKNRGDIEKAMKDAGVPVAIYYPKCLHCQPVFAHLGYLPGDFPESEKASTEVLSLPVHPFLSELEQSQVIQALRSALSN